ncbi:MAG: helix-hairpin-helix domain-containing protein [Thermoplasmatota archaeon]
MSDEMKADENSPATVDEQAKKEDMVSFLSSSGKISEDLASSLYDQGLNSWKGLLEGTEASFKKFKGIGPAKAKVLVELGVRRRDEMEASVPGLKEVLGSVPRINQKIISSLLENGYDSIESFKDKTEKDLREISGIGPKMSAAILEAVRCHQEIYGDAPGTGTCVEEATAEVEVEEEAPPGDERSLIQRIIDAIGGFFGGKSKEGEEKEAEAPKEQVEGTEGPGVEEPEKEEAPPGEEPVPEEVSGEAPVEEAPGEEVPEEEAEAEASEEPSEPEEEAAGEVEKAPEPVVEEEPPARTSFFERIKQMFFGGAKKEEGEKKPEEEAAAKEEAPPEEEGSPEPVSKEAPEPEEESAPAKEPMVKELPPAEKKEIKVFEDLPGVSKKIAEALRKAGYLNINELREAGPEDLVMIEGIGKKTAEKICVALKDQ